MAASDSQNPILSPQDPAQCLTSGQVGERLAEEVSRAERHGTALSCLLVSLDDERGLAHEHGERMPAQALAYMGVALGRQLRRFDRVGRVGEDELLVLLPGADAPRGEIVARRALGRLHAVKVELHGKRHSIGVSIGISAWRQGLSAQELLEQARVAAGRLEATAAWPPPGRS